MAIVPPCIATPLPLPPIRSFPHEWIHANTACGGAVVVRDHHARRKPSEDEASERAEVSRQAQQLLEKQDFARLEQLASRFRDTDRYFSSGVWKLSAYYVGIGYAFSMSNRDPAYWQGREKLVQA